MLNGLMDTLNRVFEEDPTKAPKIVFVMEGTFVGNTASVFIKYPLIMIGAGQNKTFLSGYTLIIQGRKEEGKNVLLKDLTTKESSGYGLFNKNGLSFVCVSTTFTQCGISGVNVENTKGRLINCVITQCKYSGIYCNKNALIELEGRQTNVDGNGTRGYTRGYGLGTYNNTSIIHLLFPLTKESVSTNNDGGGNYTSFGTIDTVDCFDE